MLKTKLNRHDIQVKALRVALVLLLVAALIGGVTAVRAQVQATRINLINVKRISWNIPESWTQDTYVYKKDLSVISQVRNKQFNYNYRVYSPDDNLTNYAALSLPIYSSWTNVSAGYVDKEVPDLDKDSKTMMKFQTLGYQATNKQCHLARGSYAYTGDYNIRMVDGRMLIALGTYYTTTIGQYIDIELENGTVLACMLGDVKSDAHTDPTHRYQKWDYSIMELVVDSPGQNRNDYSVMHTLGINGNFAIVPGFDSKVKSIRIYDKVFPIDMTDISNDNPDYN